MVRIEDIELVDAFELDAAVVVGLADVESFDVPEANELVDTVDSEDRRWVEIIELDDTDSARLLEIVELEDPDEREVVVGFKPTAFAANMELSPTVVPFQTIWQRLVLKSFGRLSQRRRSFPRT